MKGGRAVFTTYGDTMSYYPYYHGYLFRNFIYYKRLTGCSIIKYSELIFNSLSA